MSAPAGIEALEPAGRGSAVVRDLRSLSRDPKARRGRGVVLAEGIHLAQEALRRPGRVILAVASPRISRSSEGREVLRALTARSVPARRVEDAVLASISEVESHQGILLVMRRPRWAESDLLAGAAAARVLVPCGVQDPGNLGALARVAEASWATGLACAGRGADPFGTRALRASAGSLLRLPVAEYRDAAEAAERLRRLGLRLVGASPRARESYREAPLAGAMALFVGAEGGGLPPAVEGALDTLVRIPIRDGVESLNVVTAAAVILFEAAARG